MKRFNLLLVGFLAVAIFLCGCQTKHTTEPGYDIHIEIQADDIREVAMEYDYGVAGGSNADGSLLRRGDELVLNMLSGDFPSGWGMSLTAAFSVTDSDGEKHTIGTPFTFRATQGGEACIRITGSKDAGYTAEEKG